MVGYVPDFFLATSLDEVTGPNQKVVQPIICLHLFVVLKQETTIEL